MTEPQEPPTMEISWKRKPAWAREIGSTRISKKPKPFFSYVALMCDLVDQEPTNYEEAI